MGARTPNHRAQRLHRARPHAPRPREAYAFARGATYEGLAVAVLSQARYPGLPWSTGTAVSSGFS